MNEGLLRGPLLDSRQVLEGLDEVGELPPAPDVGASDEGRELIGGGSRGILKPFEHSKVAEAPGKRVLHGMFLARKGGPKRAKARGPW